MFELLKFWPALLSIISIIGTIGTGGYILYVRYWLRKEITEPVSEIKTGLSDMDTKTRNDIKALEAALSEFKLSVLQSNSSLAQDLKNTLSDRLVEVSKDLSNLWKTKVDQTSLDSKLSEVDSKIREIDNKVSTNQSQVIDYLLNHKGE